MAFDISASAIDELPAHTGPPATTPHSGHLFYAAASIGSRALVRALRGGERISLRQRKRMSVSSHCFSFL
jgi:hypothetical protein